MTFSAETSAEVHLRALHHSLGEALCAKSLYISISGLDGSGKTTLAREIRQAMTAAGIRCQVVHVFEWYKNLTVVPYRMITGRSRHQVLIFDRSIYDNLVTLLARGPTPLWLTRFAAALIRTLYPRFDHRIFLYAPFEVITRRRPEVTQSHYAMMKQQYQTVMAVADYNCLASTPAIFKQVLALLAEANGGPPPRMVPPASLDS